VAYVLLRLLQLFKKLQPNQAVAGESVKIFIGPLVKFPDHPSPGEQISQEAGRGRDKGEILPLFLRLLQKYHALPFHLLLNHRPGLALRQAECGVQTRRFVEQGQEKADVIFPVFAGKQLVKALGELVL